MGDTKWTPDQRKVIELGDRNILVSAAAGSGKTAVLVQRIIEKISDKSNPVDIDKLLVVTFTRAAAAEMKERVLSAIENMIIDNPDDEHLQRQVTLLHNAQITTIDSFCQNIIRNYFYTIDLDPVFRVGDENELSIVKTDLLQDIIEEKYSQEDEKYDRFVEFADTLSPGRTDGDIEELVLKLFNISMSYPWPMEWLKSCGEMYKCSSVEELEESLWLKELSSYVHEMASVYLDMAKKAKRMCNDDNGPGQYSDAIESDIIQINEMVEASSYTEQFEAFYRYNPARLSTKKDPLADPDKKKEVKDIRDLYKKRISGIKEDFFFQSPDEMLKDMKKMQPMIDQLIELTIEFSQAFAEKKRADGILDFADMEHFALDILVTKNEDKVEPSSVAKELQEYYDEIMTDEYQDSNFVQELILTSISRTPENKPYLFMVGDVKQSIYQFRLARPELFMKKYNTYSIGDSKYQRIDLHQNFRSRECVLESANYIFGKIMQKCVGGIDYDEAASLVPGRVYKECEYRTSDSTDIIVIEQKGEEDEEAIEKKTLEASVIGNKIRDMVQGDDPLYVNGKDGYHRVEYRDIVILLRSLSGWSEEFIETLTDMGIPAYSDTKTGYFGSLEVATMLNMLRIIDNPRQDIPLAAILRSEIGGFSDEEMACIGILPRTLNYWDSLKLFLKYGNECGEDMSVYWDMLPLDDNALETLYDKTERICGMIEEFHESAKVLSVYEILQQIYRKTEFYSIMSAMPAGEKRAANLDILLQQSLEFAENGHRGIFGFTHYIESMKKSNIDFGEASVTGESTNAVRIMSIHKSKGLQFPVVFVAGMGKKFNLTDARKATIIDADYGIGSDFIDIESRVKQPTLVKKFLANQIKRNTLAEEIRILYVALTRAEEKIIITGTAAGVENKMDTWTNRGKAIDIDTLLRAQTYLDWIIPAVSDKNDDKLFNISVIYQKDIVEDEKEAMSEDMSNYAKLSSWDCDRIYNQEMYSEIEKRKMYKYPYEDEYNIPVKISVSELKRLSALKSRKLEEDIIDEPEYDAEKVYEAPRPSFMEKEKTVTGAAKGTLYHLVMEHLPYEEIDDNYNFAGFIEQMVQKGYMSDIEAETIETSRFEWFCRTKLFKRMKKAAIAGKLKREQPFMLGVSAINLYPELPDSCDEIIMMQGIIDAYFEEDGKIVLVDYKTDYVVRGDEKSLVEKYAAQLNHYAGALERITGKEVSEKIIYSFGLGKCVPI